MSLSSEDWQQLLPADLRFDQPLDGLHNFGATCKVQDTRVSPNGVPRLVRILDLSDWQPKQRSELRDRLNRLMEVPSPYLSVPREILSIAENRLLLVENWLGPPLQLMVNGKAGLPKPLAQRTFTQLLTAVAALHARKLPHGQIQLNNLFLVNNPHGGNSCLVLADAALGTLSHLTAGKLQDADSQYYSPPEWKGGNGEPSEEADLFAVGVTACEIFGGLKANPLRGKGNGGIKQLTFNVGGIPQPARRIIQRLLKENPTDRGTAHSVLVDLQRPSRRLARALAALLFLFIGATALLVNSWSRTRETLAKRDHEIAGSKTQLTSLASERDKAKDETKTEQENVKALGKERDELSKEVKRLNEELEKYRKPPMIPPAELAKQEWDKIRKGLKPDERTPIDKFSSVATKGIAQKWEFDRTIQLNSTREWRKYDPELETAMKNWLPGDEPEQKASRQRVDERLKALDQAAKQWISLTDERDFPSLFDCRQGTAILVNSEAKKIVDGWLDEFKRLRVVVVRPVKIDLTAPKGTDRWLSLLVHSGYSDPKTAPLNGENEGRHSWKSDTAAKYPKEDWLCFYWQGSERSTTDKIQVLLEGYWKDWHIAPLDPEDISFVGFYGPLALWKMARVGAFLDKDDNRFEFTFDPGSVPGPPYDHSAFKSVPKP